MGMQFLKSNAHLSPLVVFLQISDNRITNRKTNKRVGLYLLLVALHTMELLTDEPRDHFNLGKFMIHVLKASCSKVSLQTFID